MIDVSGCAHDVIPSGDLALQVNSSSVFSTTACLREYQNAKLPWIRKLEVLEKKTENLFLNPLQNRSHYLRSAGAFKGTLGAFKGTLGALKGTLGALKGTLGALKGTLGALKGTIGALKGTIGALNDTIGSLFASFYPMKFPISVHCTVKR